MAGSHEPEKEMLGIRTEKAAMGSHREMADFVCHPRSRASVEFGFL